MREVCVFKIDYLSKVMQLEGDTARTGVNIAVKMSHVSLTLLRSLGKLI